MLSDSEIFRSFVAHEAWLRQTVQRFHELESIRSARADLVLRAATIFEQEGFGVTLYVAACGENEAAAQANLETALDRVIGALVAERNPERATLSS